MAEQPTPKGAWGIAFLLFLYTVFFLLALAITMLWVALGAAGRTITLRRVSPEPHSIRFRNIVALQAWRAAFLWVGIAGATASLMFSAWMSTHAAKPDYVIFYVLVIPLLAVIGIFCSVVNWYLSLAVTCSQSNETSSVSIQRAMSLTGAHPAAVLPDARTRRPARRAACGRHRSRGVGPERPRARPR